jgi:alpha-ketoglutarate-dependent taurine dioxygenase
MTVTISKLEEHIGAEIQDIDITSPIDDETFEQLRDAFYKYSVLVFQDQDITDEQHVAFSKRFGHFQPR